MQNLLYEFDSNFIPDNVLHTLQERVFEDKTELLDSVVFS